MSPTSNPRSLELCDLDAATDTHFDAVELSWDEKEIENATLENLLSSAMGAMLLQIRDLAPPEALTAYADHFVQMADSSAGPAPGLFVGDRHPSFSSGS